MPNWFSRKPTPPPRAEPELEPDDDDDDPPPRIRSAEEVTDRILALYAVIGKVHSAQYQRYWDWFNGHNIAQYLSHAEGEFIANPRPSPTDLTNFSWRSEALTSLLWASRLLADMPPLNEQFDAYSIPDIEEMLLAPAVLLKSVTLRPDVEITAMEQHLYHQHWRVRDAQLFGKPMPPELDPSIVYERRYGLSWLVDWGDDYDWDQVPTDT